jgi:citrate synthase
MIDSGLAGVVVTETVLSHSDGARGILWVRGHTLPELAANCGTMARSGSYGRALRAIG